MKLKKLFKLLGPGLIYAGAAVGVSHLVQSTRAGANFGFDLLWIIIIINIIKYPFFEFAPRYANATGKSLIYGYKSLGKWAIIAFALLTICTMFAIQAAVTIVTAGLIAYVFKITLSPLVLSALILFFLSLIISIGKYRALDKTIKFIIILLATSTLIAVVTAFQTTNTSEYISSFNWNNKIHIYFLIAFIGWMPSPIDVSVWSSIWSVEKQKQLDFKVSLKQSLLDFKIGYIGTTILALCFLSLGALVLNQSNIELSASGSVFAGQFISMYTQTIGSWAYYIIAIAAVATMISTSLSCLDAYPRVLKSTSEIIIPSLKSSGRIYKNLELIWLGILTIGSLILLGYLSKSMRAMVDIATTLSFVTAPILAYMNLKVVTNKLMPSNKKPNTYLRIHSYIGILLLTLFCGFFIYYRFWLN